MSYKNTALMSEREMRSEIVELRLRVRESTGTIEALRTRNGELQEKLNAHRAQLKTNRIIEKTQNATVEVFENAARCFHENLRSDEYDDVTVYHCSDCGFGWSD